MQFILQLGQRFVQRRRGLFSGNDTLRRLRAVRLRDRHLFSVLRLDGFGVGLSELVVGGERMGARADGVESRVCGAHAGTSLIAWNTLDLVAIRVGADGKAIDTSERVLAAWPGVGSDDISGQAVVADATGWLIAYAGGHLGGEGLDIHMVHHAFDLSDAPAPSFVVSARDANQYDPSLLLDTTGRAIVAWRETTDVADELRASLVDVAGKKVLVDAASIGVFGPNEIERDLVTSFSGSKADIVYGRWMRDPTILAPRIKARTLTFGALGAAACTTSDDCELGPCVDGVCCNRACDGACEACNEAGSVGTCVTVAGAPRGKHTCGGSGGCADATCDGFTANACTKFAHAFETKCAESTCKGALFTSTGYCDGRGTCAVPTTASCAPYLCDASGCLTSCSTNANCADGFVCADHKCVGKDGATCADDGLSSTSLTDGTTKSCSPFRCGSDGACIAKCDNSLDCAPGFSCDDSHVCVGNAGGGDGGGCSVVSPGEDTHVGRAALAISALLLAACIRGSRGRRKIRGRA